MVQYFKNINNETAEIDKPENDIWVNLAPPFKEEEFAELGEELKIPVKFLKDSLDIDERPQLREEGDVKFMVIKTPAEHSSFNEIDAVYITIPICIILTPHQIITVNSFDNSEIKKFLNSFQKKQPGTKNAMVLKIFEKVVANFTDYLKEINQQRYLLEQKLYDANPNKELPGLVRIQKSLIYFGSALRDNEKLVKKLIKTNFLSLNEEERTIVKNIITDISQALETATNYTNILTSTLGAYASMIANRQNEVLRTLIVLTIIVSIPTLFAAIYGMNLPIPHGNSSTAFWVLITASLIIAVLAIRIYLKHVRKT